MTIEAAFIIVLSIALFLTFCVAVYAAQEVKKLEKQDTEMMNMIYGLTAYSKVLADQDMKLLKKIGEFSLEFVQRDDVN